MLVLRSLDRVREYYDARAPEYDEWYRRLGRFDGLERPHWDDELHELEGVISSLPPGRVLDVACGTGFLTRRLRGDVAGIDQSARMLEIARERLPDARLDRGNALDLPFADGSFDRIFTAHFYGHLRATQRASFLAEARRVGTELIVVDAARRPDRRAEELQQRVLNDGGQFEVFKRYFTGEQLAAELGGGDILYEGRWFVVVASR
jgi:demethylmenaquinone methyltransferase/2-methoxy-6-polyprenyl-1,4-benzoquinol methylase